MDGTKKKSRKSVETLKNESVQREYEIGFNHGIETVFRDFEDFFDKYGYSTNQEFRDNYRDYFNFDLPIGRSDPEREINNPSL